MSTEDASTGVSAVVARLNRSARPASPTPWLTGRERDQAEPDPTTQQFVYSMLLWESSQSRATAAFGRLRTALVDFNELRVCLPDEIVAILGPRYPRVEERAERLRAALREIFARQNAVTLEPLRDLPKRDARLYLATLEGVPPFVAARVALLALGAHAFPVDSRIQSLLVRRAGRHADPVLLDPATTPETLASWLERQIRAGEAAAVYLALEGLLATGRGPRRNASSRAGPPAPTAARGEGDRT